MEIMKEKLSEAIQIQDKSIVSRQIIRKPNGNITLFAFDKDESLTEHTSPFEALVQIVKGRMTITIGGNPFQVEEGEIILLPPDIPHGLVALESTIMLLTMIK
jgi:quercetin dioxygenase-like cupin family protein